MPSKRIRCRLSGKMFVAQTKGLKAPFQTFLRSLNSFLSSPKSFSFYFASVYNHSHASFSELKPKYSIFGESLFWGKRLHVVTSA